MGEPVRIVDLARQLIRLAGMREGEDVEIVFTGLRPGEKLYEELHSDSESMRITRHERILVWDLDALDERELRSEIGTLEGVARTGAPEAIRHGLHRLVPEYLEPQLVPYVPEQEPERPPVELPVAPSTRLEPATDWRALTARARDAVIAASLLVLSAPMWAALWIEARMLGHRDFMVRETRIGRTRRNEQRRRVVRGATIDRRAAERRTLDLMGQPFQCARFRTDLGPLSRWVGRRRLDSIPFLLNVLCSDMTLVGPGPEKAELILRWKSVVPDYARRFTVTPGVTGLAQVADCSEDGVDGVVRRAHYDLYYVDNRSWLLDVRTLGRSFGVVLRRPRNGHPRLNPPPETVALGPKSLTDPPPSAVKGVTQ
jgi:lipopolysaccharide/colanic/teichoic acid biosynthesis glycosyltransferase